MDKTTQDDWEAWVHHPVTVEVKRKLLDLAESHRDQRHQLEPRAWTEPEFYRLSLVSSLKEEVYNAIVDSFADEAYEDIFTTKEEE